MKNLPNSIPALTAQSLSTGSFSQLLPELYEQQQTVEINPWHDHQSVFDHTVAVLASVERIVQFEFLFRDSRTAISAFLSGKQYGYSFAEIAGFVALMHDIGKKQTLTVDPVTGQTACPDHEAVSGELAKKYLPRFGFGARTVQRISSIVSAHGIIHELVNGILMHNDPEKQFEQFRARVKESYILYLIQGYADTAGSNLPTLNPHGYKKREIIYQEAINRFAASL